MTDRDTEPDSAHRDPAGRSSDGNRQSAAREDTRADDGGKGKAPEPSGDRTQDDEVEADKAKADKAIQDDKAKQEEKADEEARRKRRPLVISIGVVIVLLLIASGLYYWLTTRNLESTDDAYTDGRAITIASQVSGVVLSLAVNDNQFVKKDQLLIHIDPRQYVNDRDRAEGALATAKAQYEGQQFGAEVARKNFPAQLEQAQAQLTSARANLVKAEGWSPTASN